MLDLASFQGHTECVETLLTQNAKILVHDGISRRTPLHAAGTLNSVSQKENELREAFSPLMNLISEIIVQNRIEIGCVFFFFFSW